MPASVLRFAPYIAFFLSGASSLIFQTIWTRMLHHVFGATSIAISTVLTAFMAGLGLGNWLAGRVANRIKHPIFAYAFAELGVAIWGLLIPILVSQTGFLADVNAFLRQSFGAESSTFMLVRFLCVVPILIVPATLMGATFPLLTQHFVRRDADAATASAEVGALYALNTFGAATGPLLSAFVLMPTVGLAVTNVVACSMNFALFAIIAALREPLIGSKWGSGVRLEVLPGRDVVKMEPPLPPPPPRPEGFPVLRWAGLVIGLPASLLVVYFGWLVTQGGSLVPALVCFAVAMVGTWMTRLHFQEVAAAKKAPKPPPPAKDAAATAERTEVAARTSADRFADDPTHYREEAEPIATAPVSKTSKKKGGKGGKKAQRSLETIAAANREPKVKTKESRALGGGPEPTVWVPPIAKKVAFLCFAASGAAALCYEVVWSRALAMTIGSSIYSFALILETFLIGIASGSAAMSVFLGQKSRPLVGIAVVASIMTFLANVPMATDVTVAGETHEGNVVIWGMFSIIGTALVVSLGVWAERQRTEGRVDDTQSLVVPGIFMLLVPVAYGVFGAFYFDGYLPKIIASVVGAVATLIASMLLLRRQPVLLLAVVQLFIALATVVSYVWQDEIPYAFAQLVVGIENLPDHVGTVQFFMFLTAMLCTLPATLGMGAMFPLTVRVWTAGEGAIARDVSVVYTGNTVGSIIGSWLPGFVLMPWIGMERTLQAGIALNMLLALAMLIAGAAEPDEEKKAKPALRRELGMQLYAGAMVASAVGIVAVGATLAPLALAGLVPLALLGWGRARLTLAALLGSAGLIAALSAYPAIANAGPVGAAVVATAVLLLGASFVLAWSRDVAAFTEGVDATEAAEGEERPPAGVSTDLPLWHAITVYVLSPLIPALLALLWLGTSREDAILRWNQAQMTLGVFRVSLAEGMLDPESWGQPDLVFYRDGLSTTVSVERWGRHYALKNNGKVDASNGDDMPTQVTVAAYPLLMHPDGPTDLDVAVVGFGSGVTVGTALTFPVASVDVLELERAIPEAAQFFQDVNHLNYELDHFPFVVEPRLEVINDDGRNYLASTDRMYDVIISEPSNPWITGVSDLFTVDHFETASRRLRPGGIYCQWVQLYELSPENIKTIFRTFASVFPHVMVLAADDRSSDTVVLGSEAPLSMDLARFERVWSLGEAVEGRGEVSDELARAYLRSPYDVYARVLLATHDEVMTYTQIESHLRGGHWTEDLGSFNVGDCDPEDCLRRPVILNTDDNARIEFAAPHDLIGFERYDGYLGSIYSHEWPFGRIETVIDGFGEGDARARNLAELAMSLISHGYYDRAMGYIESSEEAGHAVETQIALEMLTLLMTDDYEPPIHVEPPTPGPEMDADTAEQLVEGFSHVRAAIDRGEYREALAAMEDIPSPLRLHSGPAMRFLYGYLLYQAAGGSISQYRASAETLADLVSSDEAYVTAHPEVLYYLARAHDGEAEYDQAVVHMRGYVEARLLTAGFNELPEPPASEAPTSDAPGESDKTEHDVHP